MTGSANTQERGSAVERKRAFTPARTVALALISLTAFGLVYLHFNTGKDSVSVPSGHAPTS